MFFSYCISVLCLLQGFAWGDRIQHGARAVGEQVGSYSAPVEQTLIPHPSSFDSADVGFNLGNAANMALLSTLAYCAEDDNSPDMKAITNAVNNAGWRNAQLYEINHPPVQGFVMKWAGQAIVSFRGSDEKKDWSHNAQAVFRGCAGAPATLENQSHAGFLKLVQCITPRLDAILNGVQQSRITWVGHSLGGAMAEVAAATFHEGANRSEQERGWYKNPLVYTFGAPRSGNSGFADYIKNNNIPIHGFENLFDPVPRLPGFLRFKHAGTHYTVRTKEDGTCEFVDQNVVQKALSDIVAVGGMLLPGKANTVKHHSRDGYVNCLASLEYQLRLQSKGGDPSLAGPPPQAIMRNELCHQNRAPLVDVIER